MYYVLAYILIFIFRTEYLGHNFLLIMSIFLQYYINCRWFICLFLRRNKQKKMFLKKCLRAKYLKIGAKKYTI